LRELRLQEFLPFRLNRLAAEVSQRLAGLYAERFGIDIPEWRVLATLGSGAPATAQAIVASTRTHKSTISRAVAALVRRGWVTRLPRAGDRREAPLTLTARGREVYAELVPLVLAREAELLAGLRPADRAALLRGIAALEQSVGVDQTSANGAVRPQPPVVRRRAPEQAIG
jgi:DNA-binding MarR family transcriptional regulator